MLRDDSRNSYEFKKLDSSLSCGAFRVEAANCNRTGELLTLVPLKWWMGALDNML